MIVYIVMEYGGNYEDSYSSIYAVCSTLETAVKQKEECESLHRPCMPRDEWDDLIKELERYEDMMCSKDESFTVFGTYADGILALHKDDPSFKYSATDLYRTETCYHEDSFVYAEIIEKELL